MAAPNTQPINLETSIIPEDKLKRSPIFRKLKTRHLSFDVSSSTSTQPNISIVDNNITSSRILTPSSVEGNDTPNNYFPMFNQTLSPSSLSENISVDIVLLDIDFATKYLPSIDDISDFWIRELDYIKFAIKINNYLYFWLEDAIVHLNHLSENYSYDSSISSVPYVSNLGVVIPFRFTIPTNDFKTRVDKLKDLIKYYNVTKYYSYDNGHSLTFCIDFLTTLKTGDNRNKKTIEAEIYKILPISLLKSLKKELKEETEKKAIGKEVEKALKTNEEKEIGKTLLNRLRIDHGNSLSLDYLDFERASEYYKDQDFNYILPPNLLKEHSNFKSEILLISHTALMSLVNQLILKVEKFKERYPFDYYLLKAIDRRFWMEYYAQLNVDPMKKRSKFNHLFSEKTFPFEEPNWLKDIVKDRIITRRKLLQQENPSTLSYNMNQLLLDEEIKVEKQRQTLLELRERKKDKTIKVLTLDGGGVAGVISCQILMEIEKQTGKKIYEMFDYIAGTSTGGIISFLLHKGNNAKHVKDLYTTLGKRIFKIQSSIYSNEFMKKAFLLVKGEAWYNERVIEESVCKLIYDFDLYTLQQSIPEKPLISCCASLIPNTFNNESEYTPFLFRSYPDPYLYTPINEKKKAPPFYRGTNTGKGVSLVEAIRSTSSAPFYFRETKIGDNRLVDGGILFNNMSPIALNEVKQLFPDNKKFVFVSVGCGSTKVEQDDYSSLDLPVVLEKSINNKDNNNDNKKIGMMQWLCNGVCSFFAGIGWFFKKCWSIITTPFTNVASSVNTTADIFSLVTSTQKIHRLFMGMLDLFDEDKQMVKYFRFDPYLERRGLDDASDEVLKMYEEKTREYIEYKKKDFEKLSKLLNDE
ncbi:hypothetical protein ABK040_009516 [Willaertia magna]